MTLQEKELLTRFLRELATAQLAQKDPEADALIREAVARQPDAAYLLVQRALQLEQLLDAAETRARELQAELDSQRQPAGQTRSFLSDNAWGSRGAAAQLGAPLQRTPIPGVGGGAQPPIQPQPQPQAQAMPAIGARPSWGGGGMLGTVASTAAGVVAGSFLFQGIQNLMHHGDNNLASGQTPGGHSLLGDDSATHAALPADPSDLSDLSGLSQLPDDDSDTFADSGGDDSTDFT
jgi:hypothetical protein